MIIGRVQNWAKVDYVICVLRSQHLMTLQENHRLRPLQGVRGELWLGVAYIKQFLSIIWHTQLIQGKVLTLEYDLADDDLELPITWVTAETLQQIWNSWISGKRVRLYTIRAEMESKVAMMRKTRHNNSSQKILEIIRTWPEGLL